MSKITSERELKQKQTYLEKLKADILVKQEQIEQTKSELNALEKKSKNIQNEIHQITHNSAKLIVSEHAILRYFERVLKIDIDKIKEEICNEQLNTKVAVLGNGTYPLNNEAKVVVRNKVIVTVK